MTGPPRPARVAVLGPGGAGKSVLARRLGATWDLPVTHLDSIYWGRGWTPTPAEVWRGVVGSLAAADRWVIEGGYPEVIDLLVARADLVVVLDLPRWVTIPRLVLRPCRHRDRDAGDLPRGLRHVADRENLGWAWRWPTGERLTLLAAVAAAAGEVVVLRSRADVRGFVAERSR